MTQLDWRTNAVLDRLVPHDDMPAAWDDVLARGGLRRRRLPVRRLEVALVTSLAALVLVLVSPWERAGQHGVIDRALAAVGDGPVVHLVTRSSPQDTTWVELVTGREVPLVQENETWFDTERHVLHVLGRTDGVVWFDDLERPGSSQTSVGSTRQGPGYRPTIDPGFEIATYYRDALAGGEATLIGEGTIEGQPVYWLQFAPHQSKAPLADSSGESPAPDMISARVAVDRRTYRPVRVQTMINGRAEGAPIDVVRLETMPRLAADLRPPAPEPYVMGISAGSTPVTPAAAAGALARPALWAGTAVAGRPLSRIDLQTLKLAVVGRDGVNRNEDGRALQVLYGADEPNRPEGITIVEAVASERAAAWAWWPSPVPAGVIQLERATVFGPNADGTAQSVRIGTSWTGKLEQGGLRIRIQASTREAVLAAAHALEPMASQ